MTKQRLDIELQRRGMVETRSQAENRIRLGHVSVDGQVITKPGFFVRVDSHITLKVQQQYVSRAGLKLASVADALQLDFTDTVVLDVGSSTGGFTDYALQHGARRVIAVDVGTDQLHPSLRADKRIDLYEKTDIRDVWPSGTGHRDGGVYIDSSPDIVVIDVSFISLRHILSHISLLLGPHSVIVAMVKPQFEAGRDQVNKGVIKNDTVRREILRAFESWAKQSFVIVAKSDSDVAGRHGNRERFYLLRSTG